MFIYVSMLCQCSTATEYITCILHIFINIARKSYAFSPHLTKSLPFPYFRNKSKNDKTNSNVIMSNRGGSEPNVETYTELGNTETGEPENQYESITCQEKNHKH